MLSTLIFATIVGFGFFAVGAIVASLRRHGRGFREIREALKTVEVSREVRTKVRTLTVTRAAAKVYRPEFTPAARRLLSLPVRHAA